METSKYSENLNWLGWTTPFSGYGIVMMEYAVAMDKISNGKVTIPWQRYDEYQMQSTKEWRSLSEDQKKLLLKTPQKARIGIQKTTPDLFWRNTNEVHIGYTMVENTIMGKEWVDYCNGMTAMFVPSKYLIDVFKNSGVTVPIYNVKQGIRPELFPYMERKKKNKFTFGMCGWMDPRKNWEEAIQAFTSEFNKSEPVELIIKNTNNTFGYKIPADSRVKFIDELWDFKQMQNFYKGLDCYLFPSRAEGAGMPAREAMATGLPVILTNWSGMADVADDTMNYPLNGFTLDMPDYRGPTQPGFQARIDIQELMYWMRHVYEHWDEAMKKGKKASNWMHNEWTWEVCGLEMFDILRKEFKYE